MLNRQSLLNQTSPKTDFTTIFPKCWATSRRHPELRGCIWASSRLQTSPAVLEARQQRRRVEQHLRRQHHLLLRQQPGRMVPSPLTSLPRLLPVRVPKLAPAVLRQARAQCRARLPPSQAAAADEKQSFHELIQITLFAGAHSAFKSSE